MKRLIFILITFLSIVCQGQIPAIGGMLPVQSNSSSDFFPQYIMLGREPVVVSNDYGSTYAIMPYGGTSDLSATGQYQLIGDGGSYLYVSNDYGATWTQAASYTAANWVKVYVSETGQYMSAAPNSGKIKFSNDYGVTWSEVGVSKAWNDFAMSGNGQYMAGTLGWGYLQVSNDYGATWSNKAGNHSYNGVVISRTGQYQVAGGSPGVVYFSNDYGATFVSRGNSATWNEFAISEDGVYILGINTNGDKANISIDSGVTFTAIPFNISPTRVTMNYAGDYIIVDGGLTTAVFSYSQDFGVTWYEIAYPPISSRTSISISKQ